VYNISHALPTGEKLYTNYIYNDQNNHSTGQLYSDFYKRVSVYFGTNCCSLATLSFSQSPYNIADNNGVFLGYSAVKIQNMNGGYEIDNFTNFSDYPDVISSPPLFAPSMSSSYWGNSYVASQISSFSYKRGLLKSKVIYNALQSKISETINSYGSLDAPTINEIGVQDMTWWLAQGSRFGTSTGVAAINFYNSNSENWRLTQSVQNDYDQNNINNFLQTSINYTYCPNKRFIKSINTADSKELSITKTFYYADETGIPMVTSAEQTAITAMLNMNRSNVLIHETDTRNNVTTQVHNTYNTSSINGNNGFANTYLINSTSYKTFNSITTQIKQQQNNYDLGYSNLLSSSSYYGPLASLPTVKPISAIYGYNGVYPIAKIENANSSYGQQQSFQGFGGNLTHSASYSFTTDYTGSVSFSVYGANSNLTISYYFSGASGGTLCSACGSSVNKTFLNVPAGSYYLTLNVSSANGVYPNLSCTGSYPKLVTGLVNEFYYEGFEQGGWASNVTNTGAHSGNYYYNASSGSYYVPFTLPNSRAYKLQYFSLIGGKWVLNEQDYTGPLSLTGPVDDIRVFPSDALMTTYTYSPLLGVTSQTDPSGKTVSYQYDGLGRLQTILDQDNNVLKQYDYQYQAPAKSGYPTLGMTGTPGYSSIGPTTGQGTIFGPSGYTVTVTMQTSGTPGYNYGLIVTITGAATTGPTSVTNGTASFTFVLPSSGIVNWTASFYPTGGSGGGSFSIH
jgi:YD repeat-containing protein